MWVSNSFRDLQVGAPKDVRISTRQTADAAFAAPAEPQPGTTGEVVTLAAATGVEVVTLTATTGWEEVVPATVQSPHVLDPVAVERAAIYLVFVLVSSRVMVTVVSPPDQSAHVSVMTVAAGSVLVHSSQTSVEVLVDFLAEVVVAAAAWWDDVVVVVQSAHGSYAVVVEVLEVVVVQSTQGSYGVVVVVVEVVVVQSTHGS